MQRAVSGPYRSSFVVSLRLSLLTALLGGVLGTLVAVALRGVTRPRWFRSAVDGWAAVASQLGGIPLAFAFIAALGTQGLVTKVLTELGWNIRDSGFTISDFSGWVLVYLYFNRMIRICLLRSRYLAITVAVPLLPNSTFPKL
jgi:putative spermidine/putrescine transport system permease protein